jgi:hypothetical protein
MDQTMLDHGGFGNEDVQIIAPDQMNNPITFFKKFDYNFRICNELIVH